MKNVFLGAVVVLFFAAVGVFAATAQSANSRVIQMQSNPEGIVMTDGMKITTLAVTGTGTSALQGISANTDRIGGYVVNSSTYAVLFGVSTTSTTIASTYSVLNASDATGDGDVFYFRDGTAVYQGPLYFFINSSTGGTATVTAHELLK